MTILNMVQPRDEVAYVFADTEHTLGQNTSKMIPLGHLNAIYAYRGRMLVAHRVLAQLLMCPTFDEACARAATMMKLAVQDVDAVDASLGLAELRRSERELWKAEGTDDMILVGWSDGGGHVRGLNVCTKLDGSMDVGADLCVWVAPTHPTVVERLAGLEEARCDLCDEEAMSLMRMQARATRASFAANGAEQLGIGGRLLLGKVTRGAVTVRDLGLI